MYESCKEQPKIFYINTNMDFVSLDIKTNPKHFNQIMDMLYKEWGDSLKKYDINSLKDIRNYYKKHTNIRFFYLLDGKKIAAFYSFTEDKSKLFICDVVVEVSYRQKGYSRLIIKDAFTRAINEGWSKMYLHTSKKLIPFYKKFGFQVIKQTKEDEYCMMVILNNQKSTLTQYWFLFVFAFTVGILSVFLVD
jgi:GNAT superfamily N-acetyltransferase